MRQEITVLFSCGAASAVAAYETLRLYGASHNVRIVNNIVKEEHPDNLRFLADVREWLNHPIEFAINSKFSHCSAEQTWIDTGYISGVKGATCTDRLKKQARREWEETNRSDWIVFGFTVDEKQRHDNFVRFERPNVLPVLIDLGYTKQYCLDFVAACGIKLPEMYALGFPNANCIGCVKATSPTYWNHVRKHFPQVFWQRAIISRIMGVRLVRYKNERIFLDELPADAMGRPLKSLIMPECSIFCEELRNDLDPEHRDASPLLA